MPNPPKPVNQYANAPKGVGGKPSITGNKQNPQLSNVKAMPSGPGGKPSIGGQGAKSQYANKPETKVPNQYANANSGGGSKGVTNQYANANKVGKPAITGGPINPIKKGPGTAPGPGGKPSINPQAKNVNPYGKVPGKPNQYGKVPKV